MAANPSVTHKEIRAAINTGSLGSLPLEKLHEFSAALGRSNAYTFFNVHEFPRICDAVNTQVLARSNEVALSKIPNPAPAPPAEIPDKKKDWHNKPLGKVFLTVAGGVILALVVYLLKSAFGL